MIPLGVFLWTAVLRPLLNWLRGQPLKEEKAVGGVKKDGGSASTDGNTDAANVSPPPASDDTEVR